MYNLKVFAFIGVLLLSFAICISVFSLSSMDGFDPILIIETFLIASGI